MNLRSGQNENPGNVSIPSDGHVFTSAPGVSDERPRYTEADRAQARRDDQETST